MMRLRFPPAERLAKLVKTNYRGGIKLSKFHPKKRKTEIERKADSDVPGLSKFQIVRNIFFPPSLTNEAKFTHYEIWQRSFIMFLIDMASEIPCEFKCCSISLQVCAVGHTNKAGILQVRS